MDPNNVTTTTTTKNTHIPKGEGADGTFRCEGPQSTALKKGGVLLRPSACSLDKAWSVPVPEGAMFVIPVISKNVEILITSLTLYLH